MGKRQGTAEDGSGRRLRVPHSKPQAIAAGLYRPLSGADLAVAQVCASMAQPRPPLAAAGSMACVSRPFGARPSSRHPAASDAVEAVREYSACGRVSCFISREEEEEADDQALASEDVRRMYGSGCVNRWL
jgi:hypothetical protein